MEEGGGASSARSGPNRGVIYVELRVYAPIGAVAGLAIALQCQY